MRASCISSTSLSQFLFLMARLRLPCAAASSCGRCKSTRLVLNLRRFRRRNMWLAGILLSAFALLPQPALSQELWPGAQSGMTLKQVLGVFPTAQPGNHAHLHGGASNDLSIAEYAIGEDNFTVDFFFLQDRLAQVVLRSNEVMARQSDDNLAVFNRLVTATTKNHGRPSGCQTTRNITLFKGCEWQARDVQIDIVYLEVGGQGVVLNAYYRPKITKI